MKQCKRNGDNGSVGAYFGAFFCLSSVWTVEAQRSHMLIKYEFRRRPAQNAPDQSNSFHFTPISFGKEIYSLQTRKTAHAL